MNDIHAFAPGRVNIIGEHTDYNDGLCLPFAIDRGVSAVASPMDDGHITVTSQTLDEDDRFPVTAPAPTSGWRAHVRGVVDELTRAGVSVDGARLHLRSDLPIGAGLSSSAALELAVALALMEFADTTLGPLELAQLTQRVEHNWVGARTGLLDQLAILYGRTGVAVHLDLRTSEATSVPIRLPGWRFAVVHSGEDHILATSGYNARRDECAEACALLGISSLRDAKPDAAALLPDPLRRRVRHVLTENQRVTWCCAALKEGDGYLVGALLDASHRSLSSDYEVSVPAVDAAVARLKGAGAAGARLIGGGFGGSALGLFPPGSSPPDDALEVVPSAGAHLASRRADPHPR